MTARVFDHRRIWRVTPALLRAATDLLSREILRDHGVVDHVIGIAKGGLPPARMIASTVRARFRNVGARHNTSDAAYQPATRAVRVDLASLNHALQGRQLHGRALLVDDICGSGATLRALQRDLAPLLAPSANMLTATLCLNAGATTLPNYAVWRISDWVVFPWESPPTGQETEPLPTPIEVLRHA